MNEIKYSIKNPFTADILSLKQLNKKGSTKSNHFAEFSLEGSNIKYEVGCSFGLLPDNDDKDVAQILSILDISGDHRISPKKIGSEITLSEYLFQHVNLTRVTKKIAAALIPHQKDDRLEKLLEDDWKGYTEKHDLVEFLEEFYSKELDVQELVDLLSPMLARFYSVASSQSVMNDTLGLFIADFSYKRGVKSHRSLTSMHLLNKKTIRLFHQPNPSFKPPEDDTPIIMIGPGTGIAAFLGFIQERVHRKHCHNLLFTGDRNKEYDFYFEEELKKHEQHGNLKLFTAFSRDSSHKVYVQDRLWDQKEFLFDLIENKHAHIFVSGDAQRMAKDVTLTIERIFADQKKLSPQDAHLAVKALKKEKRFHLDVY
ncbi:MAG: Sulfite reductase [NADPH] flavoprotein alpha-component [Chlamydiia bacterium]|nr:Sulfite reductase [NADPH] flavoprotein alpha-component [Chlamydiia bacterium]